MIKELKEKKAITLIALVITIVVLIILAGVIISLSLAENGLMNRALKAAKDYNNSQDKDEAGINDLYSQLMIATNDDAKVTLSVGELWTIIQEEINKSKINLPIYEGTVLTNTMPASNYIKDVNKITVPESGTYIILYNARCKWLANSAFGINLRYENDTAIESSMYSNGVAYTNAGMSCSAIKKLNKDDVIKATIYQYQNGTEGENNLTYNSLKLVRIGD